MRLANPQPPPRLRSLPQPDFHNGKDELNLCEWPLALLTDKPPRSANGQVVDQMVFADEVFDSGAGHHVQRKLTVAGAAGTITRKRPGGRQEEIPLGLPRSADEDVLIGLIQLTKAVGFENARVPFSRRQLLKLIHWTDSSDSYFRLKTALMRWAGVTLFYENAWWDKLNKEWKDKFFHVLADVECDPPGKRNRSPSQLELPFSHFEWHPTILESFQAGNLKDLDLDRYFSLSLAPSRRIFRFLDKRFYQRAEVRFDLRRFACQHIGFSGNYDNSQLKNKIRPSLAELQEKGFIAELSEDKRYQAGERRGQWDIVFTKPPRVIVGGAAQADFSTLPDQQSCPSLPFIDSPSPAPAIASPLVQKLIACGVTACVAEELVAKFPDRIAAKIELAEFMAEKGRARDKAAYLVKAIREDYAPPGDYAPQAEREKARQESARKKQERQEKLEAERRQEQHEDAKRTHIKRILVAMPPDERAELECQAIANADPLHRRLIERNEPGAVIARSLAVDAEVLRRHPFPEPPA